MNGTAHIIFGILAFATAGVVQGGLRNRNDPELILAATYGLLAWGLVGVISGGVALGIRAARE